MRLFVAVKTDRSVDAAVKNAATNLGLFGKGKIYTNEELYHITLAFIGESDRAEEVKQVLDGISTPPFSIELSGTGSFGNTYYVGVAPNEFLSNLQRDITKALREKGFFIEKRQFRPHITIARRFFADMEPVIFVPSVSQRVSSVVLMESLDGGYKTLYTKELKA